MGGGNRNLTPRELDVLACLIAGMRNREIATELNISMSTVKSHLSSLYEKLGVSTRIQAGLVGLGIFPMLRVLASQDAPSRRHAVESISGHTGLLVEGRPHRYRNSAGVDCSCPPERRGI